MKKVHLEIVGAALFVGLGTIFAYSRLAHIENFWNAQMVWSTILAIGWVIVALGYYNQGWLVHKSQSAEHVSIILPIAVFCVQCVLFVKGIYYGVWSLIAGAIVVNSGVVFSLYQIFKARSKMLARTYN